MRCRIVVLEGAGQVGVIDRDIDHMIIFMLQADFHFYGRICNLCDLFRIPGPV